VLRIASEIDFPKVRTFLESVARGSKNSKCSYEIGLKHLQWFLNSSSSNNIHYCQNYNIETILPVLLSILRAGKVSPLVKSPLIKAPQYLHFIDIIVISLYYLPASNLAFSLNNVSKSKHRYYLHVKCSGEGVWVASQSEKKEYKSSGGAAARLDYISSSSPAKKRGLDINSQLNYYLEQLNLLLPDMHLQWLFNNTKATVALIDVNPVGRSYQVLAQTRSATV
jgi:hypothetical protein